MFREDGRLTIDAAYLDVQTQSFDGVSLPHRDDRRLSALAGLAAAAHTLPVAGFARDIDQFYAISRLETPGVLPEGKALMSSGGPAVGGGIAKNQRSRSLILMSYTRRDSAAPALSEPV